MRLLVFAGFFWATCAVAVAQTPPATDPITQLPHDTVVAVVDGEAIQLNDLEAYSRTRDPKKLFQLNQQLFEFREGMLGLMLGERLLKLEAQKARMTVDEFLDRHLEVDAVTEREVEEVLSRQPSAAMDATVVRPLIRQYLQDRKREEARTRYINQLVAKAKKAPRPLVIHLKPPRQPVTVLDSDPSRGYGPVDLVEFSDFQCPFCQKVQPVLKEVMARFDGKVRHVWKDYPLPIHPSAVPAAAAARCAQEQGQFWPYHDRLFAHQEALSTDDLKTHARTLAMDTDAFDTCVDSDRYHAQIANGVKAATDYAVPATPTVFINGRMVMGVASVDLYARIISEELGD